ncbi:unnamed protein product, partial [Allacma fusca]
FDRTVKDVKFHKKHCFPGLADGNQESRIVCTRPLLLRWDPSQDRTFGRISKGSWSGESSNRNRNESNDWDDIVKETSSTKQDVPHESPSPVCEYKKGINFNSGSDRELGPCPPDPRPFHMDMIQPKITYCRFPRNHEVTVSLFNFKHFGSSKTPEDQMLTTDICGTKSRKRLRSSETISVLTSPRSDTKSGKLLRSFETISALTPLRRDTRSMKRVRSSENVENLNDSRRKSKRIKTQIKTEIDVKNSSSAKTNPSSTTKQPPVDTSLVQDSANRSIFGTPKAGKSEIKPIPCIRLSPLESRFPASVFQRTSTGRKRSTGVKILGYEYHGSESERSFEEEKEVELKKYILKGSNEVPLKEATPGEIFVCDFCLSFIRKAYNFVKHGRSCSMRERKPSDVIVYRKGDVSIFRVDGLANQSYCYNLMRLSKLYVDCISGWLHATRFHFYVLYVNDHFAGYFSKEKGNDFTLGAILILPSHQHQGYGKLLIAFSYELSKHEGKIGTPERPLTPSGRKCFFAYWCETLVRLFSEDKFQEFHVEELSRKTYIHPWDILPALRTLGDLYQINTTFVFRLARNSQSPNTNPSCRNLLDVSCVTWPAEDAQFQSVSL